MKEEEPESDGAYRTRTHRLASHTQALDSHVVKRNGAGAFAKDQMKEAFGFHLVVFGLAVALSVVGSIAATLLGPLAVVFSLISM